MEGRKISHRRGEARFSRTVSPLLSFPPSLSLSLLSRLTARVCYRIARENATAKREAEAKEEDRRARKRRRLQDYGAIHGQDMTVVTKENAHARPGWTVTPLGRIIRPMKMRPLRPLARPDTSIGKGVVKKKKKKKRKLEVEQRAKRQKIDMLKYGSVHLKGVFVDVTIPDSGYAVHADEPSGSYLVDDHGPTTKAGNDETVESDSSKESEEEDDDDEEKRVENEDDDEDDEDGDEGDEEDDEDDDEDDEDEDKKLSSEELSTSENKQSNKTTTNKLKELFAPRDEEGSSNL